MEQNNKSSILTDIDGNTYKTVTIGTQVWTAENLNVEHYRNGDQIPHVQDIEVWKKLKTGAWCYYKNNPENEKTYGKLYNWYAANDPRGLAPEGWHIPSDVEWQTLIYYFLGGDGIAGGKLKATTLWKSPNTGATNERGFTAFPGGLFSSQYGRYYVDGETGSFWSSSEDDDANAWFRSLYYNYSNVYRENANKVDGLSCRCVKD
jgi:uncharacterized protein (TIGR02145 family)